MMEKVFAAENIKCGGCAAAIEKALTELDGIESVSVEIATGMVTVKADHIDEEAIKTTLATAGYPVKN
jgi:copper chaperone